MKSSDLEYMVGKNEQILWRGKPDKKCFILESIFNPLLPFALIWGIIDFGIVGATMSTGAGSEMGLFFLGFFALHLMPVWMYLGGIFFSFRKYRNTEYIVTDRGIYVSGGVFTYNYEMKPFTDLSHINIHRGIFDQMLGVGDVISVCEHGSINTTNQRNNHSHSNGFNICDIPDYREVFQLVKDLQTDIYSDTMFPNDMRPETNHGYKTKYRGSGMSDDF